MATIYLAPRPGCALRREGLIGLQRFGLALLIVGSLSVPAFADLEAYSGAIAGNASCDAGPSGDDGPLFRGAYLRPPPASGPNTCGLFGNVSNVIQPTGIATSSSSFAATFDSGVDTFIGAGTATAKYGLVTAGAGGTVARRFRRGTAESVGYAIASDTLSFSPKRYRQRDHRLRGSALYH